MNNDKQIIQALLEIIDSYDNNDVSKDLIIAHYKEFDCSIIIKLSTKGEANKNTPFYFGNIYTCIIKEYWADNNLIHADMLYSLSPHSIIKE